MAKMGERVEKKKIACTEGQTKKGTENRELRGGQEGKRRHSDTTESREDGCLANVDVAI